MRNYRAKFSLVVLLLQSTCLILAQSAALSAVSPDRSRADAKPQAGSEWYNPTRVSLSIQADGVASTMTYEISGDKELRVTTVAKCKGGQKETSEIMLVNGQCQWMLARGMSLDEGYEIDALDGPV